MCFLLPLAVGTAAQDLLSEGVSFSGITLAVTAPEGDSVPKQVQTMVGNMRDVSRYCTMVAMEEDAALAALESGAVNAVLRLPENFIQGILYGENPDVHLLVSGEQPLESLLLLWVGQSAADLLSTVQEAIYAVLDEYVRAAPEGLSYDQAVMQINLRYINWTLNRQDLFQRESIHATGLLPITTHYALSLLAYLGLALAPLFNGVYSHQQLAFRRRLRSLGRGSWLSWCSSLLACWLVLLPMMAAALLLLVPGPVWQVLGAALGFSGVCALFGSFCCLASANSAQCGALSFGFSLAALALAGGILPPVLLPQSIRAVSWLSPVSWLRSMGALALECPMPTLEIAAALLAAAAMFLLGGMLYDRRLKAQEVAK